MFPVAFHLGSRCRRSFRSMSSGARRCAVFERRGASVSAGPKRRKCGTRLGRRDCARPLDHGMSDSLMPSFFPRAPRTGLALQRFAQARAKARQLLGAAPNGRHVALGLTIMMSPATPAPCGCANRIIEGNLREDLRCIRIAHVENRSFRAAACFGMCRSRRNPPPRLPARAPAKST